MLSGKEVETPDKAAPTPSEQEKEKEKVICIDFHDYDEVRKRKFSPFSSYKPVPPFPQAIKGNRKDDSDKYLYDTFQNCEVNILLLNVIKQVPRYAKFLKELCKTKRKHKLQGCEKVRFGENVYAIIQRKLPTKCKDPGMFTIPYTLGNTKFENAMINLRASINVMPYSIYASLKLGSWIKTGVVI